MDTETEYQLEVRGSPEREWKTIIGWTTNKPLVIEGLQFFLEVWTNTYRGTIEEMKERLFLFPLHCHILSKNGDKIEEFDVQFIDEEEKTPTIH